MFQTATASESRFNANFAISSFILGDDYRDFKHTFIKESVCPHCDVKNRIIYTPVLPATINPETDRMIRAKNEHEAGHARFTPASDEQPSWNPIMRNLVNALEDERIERGVAEMSKLFQSDLNHLNREVIADLNRKLSSGEKKIQNPFMEAIFAMHFLANGFAPQWKLSEVSQRLFDLAKDIYSENSKTRALQNKYENRLEFDKVVDIAKKIIEVWKNEMKSDDGEKDRNDNDKNDRGNQGDGESDGNEKSCESSDKKDSSKSDGKGGKKDSSKSSAKSNGKEGDGDSDDGNSLDGESGGRFQEEASSESSEKDGKNADDEDDSAVITVSAWQGNGEVSKEDENLMESCIEAKIEKHLLRDGDAMQKYTSFTGGDKIIVPIKDKSLFEEAKKGMAGKIGILASYVEQSLRTLSRCRVIGGCDRGQLDQRAFAAFAKSLTKSVFSMKTKGVSLDVAVTILVDESGSTRCEIPEYRKLAVAFSEVLDRLHIPFEILGHSTGAGKSLPNDEARNFVRTCGMDIYEHKTFDEKYQNAKFKIANMRSHNCNIDGEALLHAFKRNLVRRAARHVILVISDGMPSGTTNFEAGYKNLVDVVKVCRDNGVEVYGFGVGTELPKRFYGEECFVGIESAEKMHGDFFRRFSEIIVKGNLSKA